MRTVSTLNASPASGSCHISKLRAGHCVRERQGYLLLWRQHFKVVGVKKYGKVVIPAVILFDLA